MERKYYIPKQTARKSTAAESAANYASTKLCRKCERLEVEANETENVAPRENNTDKKKRNPR